MLDGVVRIALLAVRLVARVGIFDIAVNRPTRRRFWRRLGRSVVKKPRRAEGSRSADGHQHPPAEPAALVAQPQQRQRAARPPPVSLSDREKVPGEPNGR